MLAALAFLQIFTKSKFINAVHDLIKLESTTNCSAMSRISTAIQLLWRTNGPHLEVMRLCIKHHLQQATSYTFCTLPTLKSRGTYLADQLFVLQNPSSKPE
jgi:adenosine/AMP kinase